MDIKKVAKKTRHGGKGTAVAEKKYNRGPQNRRLNGAARRSASLLCALLSHSDAIFYWNKKRKGGSWERVKRERGREKER